MVEVKVTHNMRQTEIKKKQKLDRTINQTIREHKNKAVRTNYH